MAAAIRKAIALALELGEQALAHFTIGDSAEGGVVLEQEGQVEDLEFLDAQRAELGQRRGQHLHAAELQRFQLFQLFLDFVELAVGVDLDLDAALAALFRQLLEAFSTLALGPTRRPLRRACSLDFRMPAAPLPSSKTRPPVAWRAPRGAAWAWPMLLALAFTAAVAAWLQWSEGRDAEDERATLDSRITVWLSQEQERIATLAAALPDMAHGSGWPVVDEAALMGQPTVTAGLQRLWISATVLDAGNRIVAHVPTQAQRAGAPAS